MNNTSSGAWAAVRIIACNTCGTLDKNFTIKTHSEAVDVAKCTHLFCHDGTMKAIPPLLLPTVTLLNKSGLAVTDSYISICNPLHIGIVIKFKDVYGNQFKTLPKGFEFDLDPSPSHFADTPIELKKQIDERGKSDCEIREEIQSSVHDLYAWAKLCCRG